MTYSSHSTIKRTYLVFLMVTFSLASSTILGEAENSYLTMPEAPVQQECSIEEAEQLNEIYAMWQGSLSSLESAAQHLCRLIATQKITPENPLAAYDWLQKFNRVINQTRKLPYAPLTTHKLIDFFKFNKTLVQAITIAYNSNLNTCPSIESLNTALAVLENTIQKTITTRLPLQAARTYAHESMRLVDGITQTINNSGLTWYNHLYRQVSSVNRNLHITSTVFTCGALALVGHLTVMMMPEKFFYTRTADGKGLEQYQTYDALQWMADYKFNYAGTVNPNNEDIRRLEEMAGRFGMAIGGFQFLDNFLNLSDGAKKIWMNFDAFLKGATADNSKELVKYLDDFTLADPMFDCIRDKFGPFNNILKFLEDPNYYIGGNISISKCVLLIGTPGSGKTHSARALAGSINQLLSQKGQFERCGFIEVQPWALNNIEEVFAQAKANAPCVVFIDELQLLGGGVQKNSNPVGLSTLLTELDKIDNSTDPTEQIFVVAATNRPDLLSIDLLRPGRFGSDGRIEYPKPNHAQRKSVLEALCKKSAVDTTDINLDYFATLTQGESFSALNKIFERAGFLAKQHAAGINYDYLYQALNEVIRGLNKKVHLSEFEKNIVATHLAGIAVAHLLLDTPQKLESITLKSPGRIIREQLDFLVQMENQDSDAQHMATHGHFYTYQEHEHVQINSTTTPHIKTKLLLAGRVAQEFILGIKTSYGKDDKQHAYEEALNTLLDGYSIDKLGKAEKEEYKHQAHLIVQEAEQELRAFFTEHQEAVRRIAELLKEKEFLTADQIRAVL